MSIAGYTLYRHLDPPFTIELPADGEAIEQPGVMLLVRDPEGTSASPFRANLNLVAEALPPHADLDGYTAAGLEATAERLPGWRLIDRAEEPVGDRPGERTLASYLLTPESGVDLGRAVSVTLEQWRVFHDGLAWIVSGSCDTGEYRSAAPAWAAIVSTWRLGA
jgi:hypothetical protein